MEVLLVVGISSMLMIPLLAWMLLGLKVNATVESSSLDIKGRNLLTAYLTRDGAAASSAAAGGTDCVGGDGAGGTVVLSLLLPGEAAPSVVYSVVSDNGSTGSVWRRQCVVGGPATGEAEVVDVVAVPAGGWAAAVVCAERAGRAGDTCGRIDVSFDTPRGQVVQAAVTRRIGAAQ